MITFFRSPRLLLIIIILASLYLELQGTFKGSFAFTYDVGRDLQNTQKLLQHNSLLGPTTGQPGIFYGPWWYIILAVPFWLSHGDPRGIDAFMGLTGVGCVIAMFFLGKKIKNKWFGLLLSALTAISSQIIGLTTQIWNPNLALCEVSLLLLLFYAIFTQSVPRRQMINFFLLGLLATITFDSIEIVYGSVQFIAILLILVLLLRKKLTKLTSVAFLMGCIVIEIPRMLFEIRHQFLMSHVIVNLLTGHSGQITSQSSFEQVQRVCELMYGIWINTVSHNSASVGTIFLLLTIMCVGYVLKTKNKSTEGFFVKICLIFLGTYLGVLPFFKGTIWDHFLIGLPIIMLYLFGQSVYTMVMLASKNFRISVCILVAIFFLYIFFASLPNNKINDPSVFSNQLSVIDYIYQQANNKPFSYDVYTPPITPYTYNYLFSWYAAKKYYAVDPNANKIFYIIEPDKDHPTLRRDWLQSHDKNTIMIRDKVLFGNILVQSRIK